MLKVAFYSATLYEAAYWCQFLGGGVLYAYLVIYVFTLVCAVIEGLSLLHLD
jgi:hypothetical protein